MQVFFFSASAQRHSDSSHKLLASLSNKDNACYITKESNIIFPAVLNGNEAQTLDYIEKFCNNRKDYIVRTYTKGKKYFGKAATILKKYNLPNELKVLLALKAPLMPMPFPEPVRWDTGSSWMKWQKNMV